ncbi:MAG: twin-arginine translocation signal domain-containing protein, partial [Candidatus Margulisbacteria bacterium]|nr:twin-arginine translocation signal domain-containing protein [Candidatus Margulisiibacteriota bacterium]
MLVRVRRIIGLIRSPKSQMRSGQTSPPLKDRFSNLLEIRVQHGSKSVNFDPHKAAKEIIQQFAPSERNDLAILIGKEVKAIEKRKTVLLSLKDSIILSIQEILNSPGLTRRAFLQKTAAAAGSLASETAIPRSFHFIFNAVDPPAGLGEEVVRIFMKLTSDADDICAISRFYRHDPAILGVAQRIDREIREEMLPIIRSQIIPPGVEDVPLNPSLSPREITWLAIRWGFLYQEKAQLRECQDPV